VKREFTVNQLDLEVIFALNDAHPAVSQLVN